MGKTIIGIGLATCVAALAGCVPPPPPPLVADAPPPPPIATPIALIPEAPPLPPVRHHHAAAHPAVHHHAVHRYASRGRGLSRWSPYCGAVVHPCDVEHVTVPVQ